MKNHVLILGAGFGGLELAARLSESLGDEVRVTLIDRGDAFTFGFSKLEVMFGRATAAGVGFPYRDMAKPGVEFRQEAITAIDPSSRRVSTDAGTYDADILVVALGAEYDLAATPGFEQAGLEYYSPLGAERLSTALERFDTGKILLAILGHPFKCPPAPFEGALLLHDHFTERGVREAIEIEVVGPMAAPVPISKDVSGPILDALHERSIEYVPNTKVTEIDAGAKRARLESGAGMSYDLLIGVPVHRVPEAVAASGLAPNGWVAVERTNLATPYPAVYAIGDVANAPVAKAGVFAEAAARVVADDIAAKLHGTELEHPYEGKGNCYIEFGGGLVGKVEANFLGGPSPTAELIGPSLELAAEKAQFAPARIERWFGSTP